MTPISPVLFSVVQLKLSSSKHLLDSERVCRKDKTARASELSSEWRKTVQDSKHDYRPRIIVNYFFAAICQHSTARYWYELFTGEPFDFRSKCDAILTIRIFTYQNFQIIEFLPRLWKRWFKIDFNCPSWPAKSTWNQHFHSRHRHPVI